MNDDSLLVRMLKAMGERVNQARSTIQYLKNTIEQVGKGTILSHLYVSCPRKTGRVYKIITAPPKWQVNRVSSMGFCVCDEG